MVSRGNSFWDREKLVAEMEKGRNKVVTFKVVEKNGKVYGESREWFWSERENKWLPTKKGNVVPSDVIEDFVAHWEVLAEEVDEVVEAGAEDPEAGGESA